MAWTKKPKHENIACDQVQRRQNAFRDSRIKGKYRGS
jgi:hypothetical protein